MCVRTYACSAITKTMTRRKRARERERRRERKSEREKKREKERQTERERESCVRTHIHNTHTECDCDADNSAHINIIIIIIMRWRRGGGGARRRRRRGGVINIERQCRACPEINHFWLIVFPSKYPYNTFCEMMEWFEHPISAHIPFASACIRPAHLRALVNLIMQEHFCFVPTSRHMEVVDRVAVCLFVCRCMLFRRTAQRTNGKGQQARCLLTGTGTCQQT